MMLFIILFTHSAIPFHINNSLFFIFDINFKRYSNCKSTGFRKKGLKTIVF